MTTYSIVDYWSNQLYWLRQDLFRSILIVHGCNQIISTAEGHPQPQIDREWLFW